MPERIDWLEDGTASGAPFSPRFGDRYRSELGGLEQSRDVFMAGCGLPAAWARQTQWRILETGFGLGLNFLVTWQAWKADPLRPAMLHFVSTEAFPASADDVLRSASAHPSLIPLAQQLHAQLWGLLPGFHRLVFEGGHVLLTLGIGDAKAVLREQVFEADSVYLDGFSPQKNPDIWDIHTFKAVARCCRRGTRIATWTIARSVRDALAEAGFVVAKTPGVPPKRDNLQGEYNPAWVPKKPAASPTAARPASSCVVVGAGLAGAAIAASLARRGWKVTVLDAAATPAAGASGLPAGLLAPHVSPDDSPLSRLSRSGVRITLQQAEALLESGTDWEMRGVLERDIDDSGRKLPPFWEQEWATAAADWTKPRTDAGRSGLWHAHAGWIKPASLVKAWLETPGVDWCGNTAVVSLQPTAAGWQVLDGSERILAQAELVVLAAAYGSSALAATAGMRLALQPIRGQVSWGLRDSSADNTQAWPATPVNGHGSLIPAVPVGGGFAWITGATFERDCAQARVKPANHLENLARLQTLEPATAALLAVDFNSTKVRGWSGIRCATPTRMPLLSRLTSATSGGEVWVCSGMGSRGLTFAALCAEILAAQLHGEPLPLEQRLVKAMQIEPGRAPASTKP